MYVDLVVYITTQDYADNSWNTAKILGYILDQSYY